MIATAVVRPTNVKYNVVVWPKFKSMTFNESNLKTTHIILSAVGHECIQEQLLIYRQTRMTTSIKAKL